MAFTYPNKVHPEHGLVPMLPPGMKGHWYWQRDEMRDCDMVRVDISHEGRIFTDVATLDRLTSGHLRATAAKLVIDALSAAVDAEIKG